MLPSDPVILLGVVNTKLRDFYPTLDALCEDLGEAKVTPQLLPQARKLMADVLARHKALQPHLRQSENRLIPTSQVEHRELAELERKLMDYLDFEAELLPTFTPKYLEYDVACGGAVDYAGHKLLGTADRIDVDGEGRCAIIDYKGSISGSYALGVREEGHLGKVQALIYAQVDLNNIIETLQSIKQLDLEGVEPTFHPIGSLSNVMREDVETESFTQQVALENAPKQQDGSFLIPSILGEGGDA